MALPHPGHLHGQCRDCIQHFLKFKRASRFGNDAIDGLELALACRRRIAVDDSSVQIGRRRISLNLTFRFTNRGNDGFLKCNQLFDDIMAIKDCFLDHKLRKLIRASFHHQNRIPRSCNDQVQLAFWGIENYRRFLEEFPEYFGSKAVLVSESGQEKLIGFFLARSIYDNLEILKIGKGPVATDIGKHAKMSIVKRRRVDSSGDAVQ